MSETRKLTIEERIIQHLKTDAFFAVIADEDILMDIAKRAVKEAFFAEKVTSIGGYNGSTTKEPSIIIQAAKEIAQKACNTIIEEEYQSLLQNQELRKAIREAMSESVLRAIHDYGNRLWLDVQSRSYTESIIKVQEAFRTGTLKVS